MSDVLLKGEKVIMELQPHPLSFTPLYIYFVYFIIVNGAILLNWDSFYSYFASSPLNWFGSAAVMGTIALVWWIITLIPAAIIAVLRISWRWLIIYFLIALAATALLVEGYISVENLFHITTGVAVIGILLVDVYRRSHKYIITNYRIVTKLGFMGEKTRDIFYNKITDVVVERDSLGTFFDFGNVIPTTASGLGTGDDAAEVIVTGGGAKKTPAGTFGGAVSIGGEKGVKVARGRSSYILFGVPKPEEVRKVILENMKNAIEAYKLDKVIDLLEDIAEKKKEEKEE
ncbi:MAG: PH domain-containing protein [Candidatus Njordarchaeia archaeon]